MSIERSWEEETIELLRDLQQERQRAEQRMLAAKQQIENLDVDISAIQRLLDLYHRKYGLTKVNAAAAIVDPETAEKYRRLGPKDAARLWAHQHNGEVIVKDLCHFLAAIGAYRTSTEAADNIYSAVRRKGDFDRIESGRYRLRTASERLSPQLNGVVNGLHAETAVSGQREESESRSDVLSQKA